MNDKITNVSGIGIRIGISDFLPNSLKVKTQAMFLYAFIPVTVHPKHSSSLWWNSNESSWILDGYNYSFSWNGILSHSNPEKWFVYKMKNYYFETSVIIKFFFPILTYFEHVFLLRFPIPVGLTSFENNLKHRGE